MFEPMHMLLQPHNGAPGTRLALLVGFTSVLLGCAEEDLSKSGPRHPTIQVHGQVLVNGEPIAKIILRFIPEKELEQISTSRGGIVTQAVTDEKGNFQASTHVKGDGAPFGRYKIIMTLPERGRSWGGYRRGPDRFGGKYSNPDETEFTVEVAEDAEGPIVLEPFLLDVELD